MMLHRLGLRQHNFVKLVAAFCVFSWSACIIFHFAACMPIQKGWQVVPYPGGKPCFKGVVSEIGKLIGLQMPACFANLTMHLLEY